MSEAVQSHRRYRTIFFSLLTGCFLFRLWYMSTMALSGDESYHWEWSRNLAAGYYDHPGLTAFLIRACTACFGVSTEVTVRLAALLMLSGTAVICFFLARRIVLDRGGDAVAAERAGCLAGALMLVVPIFAGFAVYISTDPPLIFSWTLSVYLLYLAFQTERWPIWIGAGLACGLALFSKLLAVFLLPAAGLFVLISRKHRVWLTKPQPYVAVVCAMLVWLPFLWWNYTHEWSTFMFNFVIRHQFMKDTGLALHHVPEYIGGQALAVSPILFGFCCVALIRSFRDKRGDAVLFIGLSTLLPLLYFLKISFRRTVGLHWPIMAWIGCLAYMAACWQDATPSVQVRRLRRAGVGLAIGLTVVLHALLHVPTEAAAKHLAFIVELDEKKREDMNERYGWDEMGERVRIVVEEMRAVQNPVRGVFLLSDQYGMVSNVSFYTPGQPRAHLWSPPKPHGENYRFWDNFPVLKDQDAVFVVKRRHKAEASVAKLREHFETVGPIEELEIHVEGRKVRSFYIIRCRMFKGTAPEFALPGASS